MSRKKIVDRSTIGVRTVMKMLQNQEMHKNPQVFSKLLVCTWKFKARVAALDVTLAPADGSIEDSIPFVL